VRSCSVTATPTSLAVYLKELFDARGRRMRRSRMVAEFADVLDTTAID
jgi:hypothetical protein